MRVLVGLLGLLLGAAAWAQPSVRLITVSGQAEVRVAPDAVWVQWAVVHRAATPTEAYQQNEQAAAATLQAVRRMGAEERDLQVRSATVSPVEEYNPRSGRAELRGYEARRLIVLLWRRPEELGSLLRAILGSGANRLEQVQYVFLDENRAVRDEALRRAVEDARRRAELVARTLGVSIRGVWQVVETGLQLPEPIPLGLARATALAQGSGDSFAPGELLIRAQVQVSFELL
ncbi:MAG: SIMPL domain-containing protein [Bacteroidetes bacterium]|nr:SIMPL domain-containing protein [Rhodothermia bacterium]MCX7907596.1 SIMPL domain-containing protein [Bacteroidota bacterium]MDW8284473.1 SIMPL domain-containing protein [Bacteroidota bacterium]